VCILGGVLCLVPGAGVDDATEDFLYFLHRLYRYGVPYAYDGRFGFVCVLVFAVWGARYSRSPLTAAGGFTTLHTTLHAGHQWCGSRSSCHPNSVDPPYSGIPGRRRTRISHRRR